MLRSFISRIRDRLTRMIKHSGKKESPADEPLLESPRISSEVNVFHTVDKAHRRKKSLSKSKTGTGQSELKKKPSEVPAEAWDISQFEVPKSEGLTRFHDFDLYDELMHAIADLGFKYCTPIQAQILPGALKGRDAFGQAQTGTGKTAAFLITILTHLFHNPIIENLFPEAGSELSGREPGTPRSLILAPTRELVIQIANDALALSKYSPFKIVSIFGGMDYQKQRKQLSGHVDVIVATPGRLIDFMEQGDVHLDSVEILVIDEADRMMDMGFMPQVRRIVLATPPKDQRQTLMFSATLPPDIVRMASQWTREPIRVQIEPEQVEVKTIEQIIYIVTIREKNALLYHIITSQNLTRVLIFCNRKDETRRVEDLLNRYHINCAVISGDVAQNRRIRTLDDFRAGKIRVLVATDVAARGLHIEGVSHVINYMLPHDPEDYVHRIGRTGRAGATGIAISFASEDDSFHIPVIEKFLGHELRCIHPPDEWLILGPPPAAKLPKSEKQKPGRRRRPIRSRAEPIS